MFVVGVKAGLCCAQQLCARRGGDSETGRGQGHRRVASRRRGRAHIREGSCALLGAVPTAGAQSLRPGVDILPALLPPPPPLPTPSLNARRALSFLTSLLSRPELPGPRWPPLSQRAQGPASPAPLPVPRPPAGASGQTEGGRVLANGRNAAPSPRPRRLGAEVARALCVRQGHRDGWRRCHEPEGRACAVAAALALNRPGGGPGAAEGGAERKPSLRTLALQMKVGGVERA